MIKKILWVVLALLILFIVYAIYAFNVSIEVDDDFDLGLDTPPNLIRQIYNPAFDDTVTFAKFSYETEGAYTLLEIDLAPGGGNTTHLHRRFSETFIPIQGTLGVELKGREYFLEPGEQITVEKAEAHRFFNPGEERIRFYVKIEPGSAGFEKALFLLYGLTKDGYASEEGMLKDFGHTALFLKLSDTRVPGVLNLLNPFFKRAARQIQESGEADELLEKYYFSRIK
ncbi:MAG: cupin domain-containing protein [Saprospirales bacterium]|nr:MAG: cupin domain-containing protein [Saprospirales bacterium]